MNEDKIPYILDCIEKADVSFTDFSLISGISRETIYRWKNGGTVRDRLRFNMAYTLATLLEKACRAGRLPLTDKLKSEARVKVLRKIVAEMRTTAVQ